MLTFSLLILCVGVFIHFAQDRDRAWALLRARPVGADDLRKVPDGVAVAVRGPLRGGRRPGLLIAWGRGGAVGSAICVTKSRSPRIMPRKLLSGLSRLASSPPV